MVIEMTTEKEQDTKERESIVRAIVIFNDTIKTNTISQMDILLQV